MCSTTGNTNQRRRLNLQNPIAAQNISYLTQFDDGATQSYHGLLLNTTIRAARNVNMSANYTWSHCIGDATVGAAVANPGANYPHMDNRRLDRGNCTGDRRHLLNFTVVAATKKGDATAMLDCLTPELQARFQDLFKKMSRDELRKMGESFVAFAVQSSYGQFTEAAVVRQRAERKMAGLITFVNDGGTWKIAEM